MLENLFLDYANISLRGNPDNLTKIFGVILESTVEDEIIYRSQAEKIIEVIAYFTSLGDPKKADDYRKQKQKEVVFPWLYDVAFEAVFMYREGFCEEGCYEHNLIDLQDLMEEQQLDTEKIVTCYQCWQLVYVKHLSELAKVGSLREIIHYEEMDEESYKVLEDHSALIPGVKVGDKVKTSGGDFESRYLRHAYECVKSVAYISNAGQIKKFNFASLSNLTHQESSIYPLRTRFVKYLNSLVGYSLCKFLLNNDHKKLKECPYCLNFYIAKNVTRRTSCYSYKCRKAYKRDQKRFQREKDPVRYY